MSIKVVVSLKDGSAINDESDIYEVNVMTRDTEQAIDSAISSFSSAFPEHSGKEVDIKCVQI